MATGWAGDGAVQEDDRERRRNVGDERRGIEVRRHDDQSVYPTAHGAERGLDLVLRVVGAGHEQVVAARLRGLVHPANDLGEELSVQIGEEDADGSRSIRDESTGGAVG